MLMINHIRFIAKLFHTIITLILLFTANYCINSSNVSFRRWHMNFDKSKQWCLCTLQPVAGASMQS